MGKSAALQQGLEGDDWTKVKDAAERKKIQNRLAQRLHRKKYGRKKKSQLSSPRDETVGTTSSPCGTGTSSNAFSHRSPNRQSHTSDVLPSQEVDLSFIEEIVNSSPDSSTTDELNITDLTLSTNLRLSNPIQPPQHLSPLSDTNFLVLQTTNTVSALLFNASLLNIACGEARGPGGRAIFIPADLPTPKSLAPTPLQSSLPHSPYIDLLPLPALRNKLLQAQEIIQPIDIWQDLVNGEVKMWGTQSWDERSWEITESFATKWWFLMNEEVLGTTNFWRAARGEPVLDVVGLKSRIGRSTAAV